jgi:hypothetical protein
VYTLQIQSNNCVTEYLFSFASGFSLNHDYFYGLIKGKWTVRITGHLRVESSENEYSNRKYRMGFTNIRDVG